MFELLDCTLRDGGYYSSWDFDSSLVGTYLRSVARLPIRHVEIGYVNEPQTGYSGEFFYLTQAKLERIRSELSGEQSLGVMVDGKNQTQNSVERLLRPLKGTIDAVRITVAPNALDHGVELGQTIRELGFSVGFNVMYLSTFQHDLDRIGLALETPDAFDTLALVDSYGGCTPTSIDSLFRKLRQALPDATLGFHGHDNMSLAFANSLAAIDAGADVVDGTFAGMGRGAGNTRTETLLVRAEATGNGVSVDYEALGQVVEAFEALRPRYQWGTNLPYMLSGAHNLPQADVMDWIGKRRYSVHAIVNALQSQTGETADASEFPELATYLHADRTADVLIIGGGPSVLAHADAIVKFVERFRPVVLFSTSRHLSLARRMDTKTLVCLAGHEARRLDLHSADEQASAFVVPSPPRVKGWLPANSSQQIFQAEPLHHIDGERRLGLISDVGPLALALGAVKALRPSRCYTVGFDGYPTATLAEQELTREIEATVARFEQDAPTIPLISLTPTEYSMKVVSIYGALAAETTDAWAQDVA